MANALLQVRRFMIGLVLATDNAQHMKYLNKGEALAEERQDNWDLINNEDDSLLVLQLILHAADISNPAKEWNLYMNWTERVSEEFFAQVRGYPTVLCGVALLMHVCFVDTLEISHWRTVLQGDRERQEGLPVPKINDRRSPIPLPQMQAGFIVGLVQPLYKLINAMPFIDISRPWDQLNTNLTKWQNVMAREKAKAENGSSSPQPPAASPQRAVPPIKEEAAGEEEGEGDETNDSVGSGGEETKE